MSQQSILKILEQNSHLILDSEEFELKKDWVEPIEEEYLIDPEVSVEDQKEKNVKYYVPSKAELDEHIEQNRLAKEQVDQEEEKAIFKKNDGYVCFNCKRAMNITANPRPAMLNCQWNGVMIHRYKSGCGHIQIKNKEYRNEMHTL